MADNGMLASLLLQQKQQIDPNRAQLEFARKLQQSGSSMEPVRSPLEGLARALQGGLGGFMSGQAMRAQEDERQADIQGLAGLLGAKTTEERVAAAKGLRNPDLAAPLIAQLAGRQMELDDKRQVSTNAYTAAGGVVPGAQPVGPQSAATPPLPQGQPAPGGFNNNLGNIRATNLPWDDKGPPQNGFETFNTAQAGANAMAKNFGAYVQANPNTTVAQAIAKWAPPTENDTNQYIRQVAEGTGINPGMPLGELQKDPVAFAQFMEAVTKKEKGGVPQGVTADTFVNAAGGGNAQQPGQPLTINMQGPTPQGSADGSMPPQAAPQAPAAPQISPAAAELSRQAQAAYRSGDPARAAALQQKAQEVQAAHLGDIDKENRAQSLKQPQENITNEGKLRDDFNNLQPVKDYRKAATVFRSAVEAARQNSKASDLNMVYAFATMMDPGSVVRDQESNMVIATAGASDRIKGLVAGLAGNSALGPDVKEKLLNEMGSRYEAYKVAHDNLAQTFTGIAQRSNANPQNVITPFPEVPYTKKTDVPNAKGADLRQKYGLE